jgi:hypothetical protein
MTKYDDIIEQIAEDLKSAVASDGSLNLKGTGGSIAATANGDTIGVWITPIVASGGVPCISIYANKHQCVLGLYGPDKRNKGCTVALSVDHGDGQAYLQVCRGEEIEVVNLMDLVKAAKLNCLS